jgi:hypothetical protein
LGIIGRGSLSLICGGRIIEIDIYFYYVILGEYSLKVRDGDGGLIGR